MMLMMCVWQKDEVGHTAHKIMNIKNVCLIELWTWFTKAYIIVEL